MSRTEGSNWFYAYLPQGIVALAVAGSGLLWTARIRDNDVPGEKD